MLLIHRGEVVSTDRLIDELWGERAPATGAKTVHVYVSSLRRVLGDDVIITRGHGYMLAIDADQIDVGRFEALVAEGRSALAAGDMAAASKMLGSALALWRGEPLADFAYGSFAQSEIARLTQARLAALEDRADAELALGQHASLVGELEALVREHPARERLQSQLMLALYRSGRQADALVSYRKAREALIDELGLEPGRALQELERAILAQDPALDLPARASTGRGEAARGRVRRGGALIAAGGSVVIAAVVAAAFELTGGGGVVKVSPNSVAAIDTHTNRIVGQVPVGARPRGVAFGSGSLWVANLDDQSVSRIDPKTLRTARTLDVRDPPTGIAASSGSVWVVGSNANATTVTASRIDPQFDVVANSVRIGNIVPGDPGTVAAKGSSVWVAPSSGLLTRLDPRTGRARRQVDPNASASGIDLGAGALWVTDSEADNVTRVDLTGLLTSIAVGHGPSGIAVGAGGVWVADSLDDAVVRIDPSTRAVTTTIPVGRSPTGVAVGAGSVWVANSGDGTVTRIDPSTDSPVATIVVGGSPQAMTVAGGRAWVTVDAQTIGVSNAAARGGTLRIDSAADVDFMDPALAYNSGSEQLLYATCAKLLNYPDKPGPAGSQLIPEVALSLPARSTDGKTYTFTIRNGFRFSPPSNAQVTAQTFKDTIERSLNPVMKSPVAHQFEDIVGAGAYIAGKAPHIAGVVAHADRLTIRLLAPAPDLLARVAEPVFCAVPSNTPIDPKGVRVIPSAGPYYVASYTPGQGVVLVRNPNYRGSRPHLIERIEFVPGIPTGRAVAAVEAGRADYTTLLGSISSSGGPGGVTIGASQLAARYGLGSPAATRGLQQYFVNAVPQLDAFDLNTHRPLFSDVRMRRAVNYAIDRSALARLGDGFQPLPERATDHYLPPGIPGFSDERIYPSTPDVARARQLVQGRGRTAVLYTCDVPPCDQQAQILKADLAAIGLRLEIKTFPFGTLFARLARPGEPFDLGYSGWLVDYPDPAAMLNPMLEDSSILPTFDDPTYRRRLAATDRLSGPARYLTYGRLDVDLARNAAPLAAYGNMSDHSFFSARTGCQIFGVYGIDIAALCISRRAN